MNRTHAAFDPEAFLMAFKGRHDLLEAYLDTIPSKMLTLKRPLQSWEALRDHIAACSSDELRPILSGFREAYELCTEEGHEQLLQVCRLAGRGSADILELPAECLAVKILTEDRELFESALSLDHVMSSDALELFKPEKPLRLVKNIKAGVSHFRAEMAQLCGSKYGSQRILLKHFHHGDTLTVGFYFEKAPKAQRLLDGSAASPRLKHEEVRPIQMDFVIFEASTGVLSVKSAWGRHTDEIRRAFGAAFLQDEDAYYWSGARDILELRHFVDPDDETISDVGAVVTDVYYGFPSDPLETRYYIHAVNVREVLERDRLSGRVQEATIRKAVVQIPVPRTLRKRRVVLQTPNKIEFSRTSGVLDILRQLHDWHVFNAPIASQAAA